MLTSIRFYSLFLLLFASSFAYAQQASLTASANARQVVIGNSFEVVFTIKNAQGSITPPPFKHFELISNSPSRSMSTSILNGRMSQEVSYTYTLRPKKIGRFTISPATAVVNGKRLTSNKVSVEVVKGKNNATSQSDINKQIEDQVFVRIIPSTNNARIGQQIVVDYKLYTTVSIEQYNLESESAYDGFYAQNMRQFNNKAIQEVENGVQYTTKILKSIALFPQQAGKLTIEGAKFRLGISAEDPNNKRTRSFFYRPKVNWHNTVTNAVDINVLSLPPNPPTTFTGAVGKFNVSAVLDRRKLTTDEDLAIRMTVQGNGDIKQIKPPPLEIGDNFEVYEPRVVSESTYESGTQIISKKEFEYLVLPKKPGKYRMQPIFSYFDTDSLSYLSMGPRPYMVEVTKGSNKARSKENTIQTKPLNNEIRFIATNTSLQATKTPFFGSTFFWILWSLPLLFLGGVVLYKQKIANQEILDPSVLKQRQAQKLAQMRLSTAEKHLQTQKSKAFYDEISRAMLGYVCDKLKIPTSELTKDNVHGQLEALQVEGSNIERFMEIIKNCEIALFAGMDNSAAMQSTYDNAFSVVAGIEAALLIRESEEAS